MLSMKHIAHWRAGRDLHLELLCSNPIATRFRLLDLQDAEEEHETRQSGKFGQKSMVRSMVKSGVKSMVLPCESTEFENQNIAVRQCGARASSASSCLLSRSGFVCCVQIACCGKRLVSWYSMAVCVRSYITRRTAKLPDPTKRMKMMKQM